MENVVYTSKIENIIGLTINPNFEINPLLGHACQ
jgi:hypothetical protein